MLALQVERGATIPTGSELPAGVDNESTVPRDQMAVPVAEADRTLTVRRQRAKPGQGETLLFRSGR
jgi:hypothetical protein